MFISLRAASERFGDSISPAIIYMAAAQPQPKRRIRLTGMRVLASNCGNKYDDQICSVWSDHGL
jgi:hypothetical protein